MLRTSRTLHVIPIILVTMAGMMLLGACVAPPQGYLECSSFTRATPSNVNPKIEKLTILIQPPDNYDDTAQLIARDIAKALGPLAREADAIQVAGYIYGGTKTPVREIHCLNAEQQPYLLALPNSMRAAEAREGLARALAEGVARSIRETEISDLADPLPLLYKVQRNQDADVLLWTTLFSHSDNCLDIKDNSPGTVGAAEKIITGCVRQGQLPDLSRTPSLSLLGVGSGTSGDEQMARPLLSALAKGLCARLTGSQDKCRVE